MHHNGGDLRYNVPRGTITVTITELEDRSEIDFLPEVITGIFIQGVIRIPSRGYLDHSRDLEESYL